MSLQLSSMVSGIAPSATLRLTAQAAQLKKEGKNVISLCAGEPDFPTPAPICAAAVQAIADGHTRYTDVSGIPALRQAIARHIKAQKGLCYAPDEIIVGNGAKQLLYEALLSLLNPGDEVLLPAPCWVSYPEIIRMAGGVPVLIPSTAENHFLPDDAQLAAAITERTRAIIINTPGNPTGAVWPRALLERVMHIARTHALFVISDEIYERLVYDGCAHLSPAQISDDAFARTLVVSGLSKTYAMTGWRVGYASGPKALIAAMDALQSHMTGNCCTPAQHAALAALQNTQPQEMIDAFAARRLHLLACLQNENLPVAVVPEGAFYLLMDVRPWIGKRWQDATIANDAVFAELLLQNALVAVVPGSSFFADGFIRMSYAASEDALTQATKRIGQFVRSLK